MVSIKDHDLQPDICWYLRNAGLGYTIRRDECSDAGERNYLGSVFNQHNQYAVTLSNYEWDSEEA